MNTMYPTIDYNELLCFHSVVTYTYVILVHEYHWTVPPRSGKIQVKGSVLLLSKTDTVSEFVLALIMSNPKSSADAIKCKQGRDAETVES